MRVVVVVVCKVLLFRECEINWQEFAEVSKIVRGRLSLHVVDRKVGQLSHDKVGAWQHFTADVFTFLRPFTSNHVQNNNGLTIRLRDSRPHLPETRRLYKPSYPIAEARPSSRAAFATISSFATVAHNLLTSLRTPTSGLSASTSPTFRYTYAACVYLFYHLFRLASVTFTYFPSSSTRTNGSPRG